ncbi:hypothetical protein CCR75_004862 [Bremia lactucae]|uniref:Uncharacterized protein n=1 Tax=Bremia lactucae TaxID=4779 RepID=A0A976NYG5_BRELC|nr:hypothetical protein CCR75_004862 [Bremia lactucae]
MILLPAHQQMKNTGSTFGHYANQTVRYLMQHENQNTVFSVACPPHRHLEASSVGTCLVKTCSLKSTSSSSDLKASCPITCNHVAPADVALCAKHCDCIDETKPGTTCWMLCVENLATDVCPGEQKCNTGPSREQLAMTCPGGLISPPSVAPLSPATAPLSPATAPLSPATAPLTTSINNSMTSPATTLNAGTMETAPLSPDTESTVTETTVLETTVPDPTESGTLGNNPTAPEATGTPPSTDTYEFSSIADAGGDNLSPNVSTNAKVIPDANEADSMTGPLDPEDGPSDTISLAPRSNSGAMLLTSVAVLGAVIGCM